MRTHYRLGLPVVEFTFICIRCSDTFPSTKPVRTCPVCRGRALAAGGLDPELEGEFSGC